LAAAPAAHVQQPAANNRGAILAVNLGLYFGDYARGCFYGGDRETRTAYYVGKALAGLNAGERAVVVGNARFRYGTHATAQYLNPSVEVENWLAPLPGGALRFPPPRLFLLIPERQGELAA
jgi:hypothetical protein